MGAPASLTFDALPGVQLSGVVARIKPIGAQKQGDMTYTVVVRPDRHEDRLLWNMTATVPGATWNRTLHCIDSKPTGA